MPLKANVARLDFNVLHHDRLVLDTHSIRRKHLGIDWTLNRFVNRQLLERSAITASPWLGALAFAAMFFRRMIRVLSNASSCANLIC